MHGNYAYITVITAGINTKLLYSLRKQLGKINISQKSVSKNDLGNKNKIIRVIMLLLLIFSISSRYIR
jgi:hypothetical protein